MSIDPILTAPSAIQFHVVCALLAVFLGPVVLLRKSRDWWHRRLGYVWVIAMALAAVTSFWISEMRMIGPFGPIHALSAFTLYGLWQAITAIRARRIAAHEAYMKNLYFWAMGVAGLFTFLPGRRMNMIFFDNNPTLGFTLMALLIGSGLGFYAMRMRRREI
jgi:uncharacterized membrane protein